MKSYCRGETMSRKYKDPELDWAIVCKNCGHIKDWHDWDEYSGDFCTFEGCYCTNFDAKTDKEGNVIYNEQ